MDIALLVILLIVNVVGLHRLGKIQPKTRLPQPELTPPKAHRLVRTWIEPEPDDSGWPGWRFLCTCGTQGMATNCADGVFGSEQNVVKQFSDHAALYAAVDEDGWKHKHDLLRDQFAWYVKTCYCKDSNDELIVWRNK